MQETTRYADSYFSMTWLGPKGYPEQANAGRCDFTGVLGQLRHFGEEDLLFADGRVAVELGRRGRDADPVAGAMQQSSELFQSLRYESRLPQAGALVKQIAQCELAALAAMREGWEQVRQLPRAQRGVADAA